MKREVFDRVTAVERRKWAREVCRIGRIYVIRGIYAMVNG